MAERVVVFLDYQNVYRSARRAFCDPFAPHWEGQIDPVRLAELIVRKRNTVGVLEQVRVYRGQPDSTRDPKGYGASQRQNAAWQRDPRVGVVSRPLRYPRDYPATKPEEKGIDVELAVDFIAMAIRGQYDVGVLMSEDTDLKPALEAVTQLPATSRVRCEVAAWRPSNGPTRRLRIAGPPLWCHLLGEPDYRQVIDPTNYAR